jgi:Thioesterase domain
MPIQFAGMLSSNKLRNWKTLVPVRTTGSRLPFFCVHGNVGALIPHLRSDQPVYWLHHGADGGLIGHMTVEEIAAKHLEEILDVQRHCPYYLGGFGFGGILALEIGRQLHRRGKDVAPVALFSCGRALFTRQGFQRSALEFLWAGNQDARARHSNLPAQRFGNGVRRDCLLFLKETLNAIACEMIEGIPAVVSRNLNILRCYYHLVRQRPMHAALVEFYYDELFVWAMRQYKNQTYPGRVTLFLPEDHVFAGGRNKRWTASTEGEINVRILTGRHGFMDVFADPYVREVANHLTILLSLGEPRDALPPPSKT